MITKGKVEKIEDKYFARVRLPVYNGAKIGSNSTPSDDLSVATICTIPQMHPNLKEGDIVFVGFEDNDMGKPIILGCLYGEFLTDSYASLTLNSLRVLVDTHLSEETSIGNTTPDDIKNLSNTSGNLQAQINLLSDKVEKLIQDLNSIS